MSDNIRSIFTAAIRQQHGSIWIFVDVAGVVDEYTHVVYWDDPKEVFGYEESEVLGAANAIMLFAPEPTGYDFSDFAEREYRYYTNAYLKDGLILPSKVINASQQIMCRSRAGKALILVSSIAPLLVEDKMHLLFLFRRVEAHSPESNVKAFLDTESPFSIYQGENGQIMAIANASLYLWQKQRLFLILAASTVLGGLILLNMKPISAVISDIQKMSAPQPQIVKPVSPSPPLPKL
jgi:hypothetical protein